ncbi:MAG TPA: UDP-N-acetylglucosamine 1-carboxyvinyltransferase [candidate division Zixibacteria bacterium]|nr:UDP-N-acetylglucosamine 1-carboxyvinyltransferase [candidate division Zixibacteria bacterium]
MDKFVVNGGRRLRGKLQVEGSKNAALPIICGALLIRKGKTIVRNVPPLRDIRTIIRVLEYLGAVVEYDDHKHVMAIDASRVNRATAPYELMRQMRGSFLVLGPLLARMGQARVSLPGGCVLGARPVNFHIQAFKDMGARVTERAGYVVARAKQLAGGSIYFDRPSHTGTENILFGAVTAKNKTYIANAACDPEIVDVANFLNKAGAKIHGAGTPNVVVEPVKTLKAVDFRVSGDRLVAGTYLIAAAVTAGDVSVSGIDPNHLTLVLHKLQEMGCRTETERTSIRVKGPKRLKPVSVTTFPFPGFPTDLQACIMAAACIADGTSNIRETVFRDRWSHTMEMRRLGAEINVSGDEAIVFGTSKLQGAEIMASDIRAGAGIILAALAAEGKSEILRVYHVDRGYSRMEEKLSELGADITRVTN